jgi:zinc D-Ala-D-Ala carboxypeptidase
MLSFYMYNKIIFMQLSKNLSLAEFSYSELAKRKGINNTPKGDHLEAAKELAKNIFQPISNHFQTSIFISSGYRSQALNSQIKGASKTSQHSKGEAIDIDMDGRGGPSNTEIFHYIKENLNFDQLIWEFGTNEKPDWVHVSYKKGGPQRKQILRAVRNSSNKVVYQPW